MKKFARALLSLILVSQIGLAPNVCMAGKSDLICPPAPKIRPIRNRIWAAKPLPDSILQHLEKTIKSAPYLVVPQNIDFNCPIVVYGTRASTTVVCNWKNFKPYESVAWYIGNLNPKFVLDLLNKYGKYKPLKSVTTIW